MEASAGEAASRASIAPVSIARTEISSSKEVESSPSVGRQDNASETLYSSPGLF